MAKFVVTLLLSFFTISGCSGTDKWDARERARISQEQQFLELLNISISDAEEFAQHSNMYFSDQRSTANTWLRSVLRSTSEEYARQRRKIPAIVREYRLNFSAIASSEGYKAFKEKDYSAAYNVAIRGHVKDAWVLEAAPECVKQQLRRYKDGGVPYYDQVNDEWRSRLVYNAARSELAQAFKEKNWRYVRHIINNYRIRSLVRDDADLLEYRKIILRQPHISLDASTIAFEMVQFCYDGNAIVCMDEEEVVSVHLLRLLQNKKRNEVVKVINEGKYYWVYERLKPLLLARHDVDPAHIVQIMARLNES
jgi:hypothetical protein